MTTPTPPVPAEGDLGTQVALMRQAFDFSHKALIDGQGRIETSVGALRDEVARNYVDKVEFGKLEGRVTGVETKASSIDSKVSTHGGYFGWVVKTVIGLIMVGISGLLFAKGGMHP